MTKTPNLLVDQPHSLGALLRCALLPILFTFSTAVYAQYTNSISSGVANATVYSTPSNPVQTNYQAYQSTIYEPFTTTTPSSQSASAPSNISGRRNSIDTGGFGTLPDPNQSTQSPVGEPWIMLIFACIAAAILTLRNRLQKSQA